MLLLLMMIMGDDCICLCDDRFAALLRFVWRCHPGAAGADEGDAAWAPVLTNILHVFLTARRVSTAESLWNRSDVVASDASSAVPVPSSSLRVDWLTTVTDLLQVAAAVFSKASAVCSALVPELPSLFTATQVLTTDGCGFRPPPWLSVDSERRYQLHGWLFNVQSQVIGAAQPWPRCHCGHHQFRSGVLHLCAK